MKINYTLLLVLLSACGAGVDHSFGDEEYSLDLHEIAFESQNQHPLLPEDVVVIEHVSMASDEDLDSNSDYSE